nr:hypothetical protein [Bifidobacterium catenulatum]
METYTEQLPHPKDFRSLFDGKIYQRAQAYYDAGMVQHVSQVAPSLWHAQVMGSDAHYDVDIRIRHSRIVSAACTCPYGQKHTIASMWVPPCSRSTHGIGKRCHKISQLAFRKHPGYRPRRRPHLLLKEHQSITNRIS